EEGPRHPPAEALVRGRHFQEVTLVEKRTPVRIGAIVIANHRRPKGIDLLEAVVEFLASHIDDEVAPVDAAHESAGTLVAIDKNGIFARLREYVSGGKSRGARPEDKG